MMIPPVGLTGPSILDLVAQRTQLRPRLLLPCSGLPPATPLIPSRAASPTLERLTSLTASDDPVTDHALLVLLGHFAQQLGLLELLSAVPIAQKTVDHRPQTKLIEFLIAILAGLKQLQELNDAASPLVQDRAVQHAWGQEAFAHYSGVSRTLAAADATSVRAVREAVALVSRPFIDREVLAIVRAGQPLTVDIDLTGRVVSPSSTDYLEAAFGWMDDSVAKGYQSAISSLSGGPSGRLLLGVQRYDGRATSADSLRAAVTAVEQSLGRRPQRRTQLVQLQLDQLRASLAKQAQTLAQCVAQQQSAQARMGHLAAQATSTTRLAAQEQRLARLAARVRRLERELWKLRQQQADRQVWLAQLTSENQAVTSAVEVVIRLDAGFATDANLAWLIEMGYTVLSKAHSGQTSRRLQRALADTSAWTRVRANAEALALGPQRIGDGRYALEALQVRYHLPEGVRHTTLLYYGDAPAPPAPSWFARYNARQTIEAGIKENKRVFTIRRPLVRSPFGMQLQEEFALFAANFVRWAAAWAREQLRDVPAALSHTLSEVKSLVTVVAHSRARLVETPMGCALVFDSHSAFAGAVLIIWAQAVFQTVLPLFTLGTPTSQKVT